MTLSPFTGELAADRRRELLQRAIEHRLWKSARSGRGASRANALTVRVRVLRPDDATLLAKIFADLGPASRFARYLAPKRELSAADLRYFTAVDHHNHEALIASTRLRGRPIGVARFIRDREDPTSADVAVEVVDDWQNRGVGSLLAERLAGRARRANIKQFTALMAADNPRSRRLLMKMGTLTHAEREGSAISCRVALGVQAPAAPQRYGTPAVPGPCA